jgi:Wadjet anti plasmid transformation system JetA-like protein/uncharacterized protein DUF3322
MNGDRTSDAGVRFLERLLERSERNPDRLRPASAAPEYDDLSTAQQVGRFHDLMAAAQKFGAIEVQRGRRDRGHLIERVRVRDPELLAKHLGRPTATVVAQRARAELLSVAEAGEPWVSSLLEEMTVRWARGESYYRLTAAQPDAAKEFFTLLAAFSRQEGRGLDARTFSFRATKDTKAFDRHASRLAAALGARLGLPGAPPDRVWALIGLDRFSHPIHVSGPVRISDQTGILVNGTVKPFASIHPEMLPNLEITETPSAILTVENYASFNRQVREIEDGSLVVYTGGFPAAGVIEFLSKVLAGVAGEVPFLHWGDIDAGGLRIFRYLEENLLRGPQPHLMTRKLASAYGQPAAPDASLTSIAKSESGVSKLADWLAFGTDIRHLEQEALEPRSPIWRERKTSRANISDSHKVNCRGQPAGRMF